MNSWVVVTYLDTAEMLKLAVQDAAAQEGLPFPPRVLAVSNGSSQETRRDLETCFSRMGHAKVLPWWFEPALPSLSGVWNRGLDFCWAVGAEEVLVTQADVRLHQGTYEALRQARLMTGALMVTAVGRREHEVDLAAPLESVNLGQRGGPDYSAFLISREAHERYRFDEAYTPCFAEDCDNHRRFILGGDGDRIFSVNVPYVHHASETLKQMSEERRRAVQAAIAAGAYAHHERKWGGSVNNERFIEPFDDDLPEEEYNKIPAWIGKAKDLGQSVTTPVLFESVRSRW